MDVIHRMRRLPQLSILVPNSAICIRIVRLLAQVVLFDQFLLRLLNFLHLFIEKLIILCLQLLKLFIDINILYFELIRSEIAVLSNVDLRLVHLTITGTTLRITHLNYGTTQI